MINQEAITPAGGIEAQSDLGSTEDRIAARVIEQITPVLDALKTDVRAVALDRRQGEKLLLEGARRQLDALSSIRARLDMVDEHQGSELAWHASVERRLSSIERGSFSALEVFVEAKRESTRAKALRRTIVADGARAVGRGVVWLTSQREVRLAFVGLVVVALGVAAAIVKGWV